MIPELPHAAHSSSQHSLATAWLIVEWPGHVVLVPEIFTLLWVYFLLQCGIWFHYLFALNCFVVCYHFLALHFAHWLKETEQSCVLHAFREKEQLELCVLCFSPNQFASSTLCYRDQIKCWDQYCDEQLWRCRTSWNI